MSIQAKASGMTGPRGHIIALSRWRSRLAMIASLNTVFLTLFAIAGSLIMYVRKGIDPAELFHWFTINSNSLTAVGACMIVPFAVEGISKKYFSYPKWVAMLHYSGMVCTTLTMVFAAAFISWVDPELAFGGSNLYLHILCPCLVLVSFFLVESGHHLTKKDALIACIPTFLYELIYLWCVFIVGKENGGWEDMYFMNTYIPFPVSAVGITALAVGISLLIGYLYNRQTRKRHDRLLAGLWPEGTEPAEIKMEIFGLGRYMGKHADEKYSELPLDLIVLIADRYGLKTEELMRPYMRGFLDSRMEKQRAPKK